MNIRLLPQLGSPRISDERYRLLRILETLVNTAALVRTNSDSLAKLVSRSLHFRDCDLRRRCPLDNVRTLGTTTVQKEQLTETLTAGPMNSYDIERYGTKAEAHQSGLSDELKHRLDGASLDT
jgi:hypothetical protein